MNKTIAEIDRLDALWASSDTGNDFCASLPWAEISEVLRAAANVAKWNPSHGDGCVYSGGGPCDCGLPELRESLDALGQ